MSKKFFLFIPLLVGLILIIGGVRYYLDYSSANILKRCTQTIKQLQSAKLQLTGRFNFIDMDLTQMTKSDLEEITQTPLRAFAKRNTHVLINVQGGFKINPEINQIQESYFDLKMDSDSFDSGKQVVDLKLRQKNSQWYLLVGEAPKLITNMLLIPVNRWVLMDSRQMIQSEKAGARMGPLSALDGDSLTSPASIHQAYQKNKFVKFGPLAKKEFIGTRSSYVVAYEMEIGPLIEHLETLQKKEESGLPETEQSLLKGKFSWLKSMRGNLWVDAKTFELIKVSAVVGLEDYSGMFFEANFVLSFYDWNQPIRFKSPEPYISLKKYYQRIKYHLTKALVDSDDDGLPDQYEASVGTSPTTSDTDQDGLSDLFEVRTGRNPLVLGQ